jgi:hypothetical protein
MGLLALIDFALIRFSSGTFSKVRSGLTMLNRLILLPVWLVWLGYQLPRAKLAATRRSDDKGVGNE